MRNPVNLLLNFFIMIYAEAITDCRPVLSVNKPRLDKRDRKNNKDNTGRGDLILGGSCIWG